MESGEDTREKRSYLTVLMDQQLILKLEPGKAEAAAPLRAVGMLPLATPGPATRSPSEQAKDWKLPHGAQQPGGRIASWGPAGVA